MKTNNSEIGMHPDLEYLARNQYWWNGDYTHAYVIIDEGHPFVRFNDGQGFVEDEWLQARKDLGLIMSDEEEEIAAPEWAGSVPEGVKLNQHGHKVDSSFFWKDKQYSAYYKDVRHIDTLDVYRVVSLFDCEKHGHPISHAAKKLLLSGSRTGGKDVEEDVREAIDSLYRWLEMREEDKRAL